MKIILFGASGMIGQSVLRECLLDPVAKRAAPKSILECADIYNFLH